MKVKVDFTPLLLILVINIILKMLGIIDWWWPFVLWPAILIATILLAIKISTVVCKRL